ncbi:hypothetical protein [Halocatena halophila]|uniref:hypothetical protein n=1 Tax=Halocatena halophila TaxID=2814576 RepID=UPI002ED41EA4
MDERSSESAQARDTHADENDAIAETDSHQLNDDAALEIATQEANDTFQSISNLDSICDTSIVGITFLLTAIVGWAGFALPRLPDRSPAWLGVAGTVVLGAVAIFISSFYIVKSLIPRAFYTDSVGEVLIDQPLVPGSTDPTTAIEATEQATGESSSKAAFDHWLNQYGNDERITSAAAFQYARLFHYKTVAQMKATATTHAIVWFRVAVGCVVVSILVGTVGLILA